MKFFLFVCNNLMIPADNIDYAFSIITSCQERIQKFFTGGDFKMFRYPPINRNQFSNLLFMKITKKVTMLQ